MQRRLILIFGVLVGLMWMGEVILGNLGDTTVLGNVRTAHFHAYRMVGWSFVAGALGFTAAAGFFAAFRTGRVGAGVLVASWSGPISGAMVLVTLLALTVFFRDALLMAPSNIREFAGNGQAMFWDYVRAGVIHVWIGPLLGVTLGAAGAVVGKALGNRSADYNRRERSAVISRKVEAPASQSRGTLGSQQPVLHRDR